jgi:hypothetical protein
MRFSEQHYYCPSGPKGMTNPCDRGGGTLVSARSNSGDAGHLLDPMGEPRPDSRNGWAFYGQSRRGYKLYNNRDARPRGQL